jgi:tetratricopeptide (TPR) repeat protein
MTEYEKFLTLYEKSPGAPYAQLMWSHCLIHLKKPVTAMREGFQSVIDYWPESHEATLAAYCIGDAYRKMGEVKKAQKAFQFVIAEYPGTDLALRSTLDLLHYAKLHKDEGEVLEILTNLTFKWKRTKASNEACVNASRELAAIRFNAQDFEAGRKALATSYPGNKLVQAVFDFTVKAMQHLLKQDQTRPAAQKLGDQLIASLRVGAVENPEEAKPLLYRACETHAMLGRPSEVWKLYEEIAKRWGRDDGILGRMAGWCLKRDQRDKAVRLYKEFENVVAGQQKIAKLLEEEGKHKEAIAVYLKLIDLNGDNASGYLWAIGNCHEKMAAWKKAIAIYRQIDEFPKNYFAMANCHRKLNEQTEAIVLYNQCKVHLPSASKASLNIGFTYEEAKEREKAIRTFQLTCKRYPKSKEAGRAHAHLQNEYNINVTLGGAEDE